MMKSTAIKLILTLILLTGIFLVIFYRDQIDLSALEQWVASSGSIGFIAFILIYSIATVFSFPGSVLTLLGGALFGPVLGTFINLTGATLGAAVSFLVARYVLSDWVEAKTGGRLRQLKKGIENEGWRFVAFVRLVPLFPFNLLNYALGLTRIRFSHYVVTSYICMLPGGFAYTYLGYAGKQAVTGDENVVKSILIAFSLLAVVLLLPKIINSIRRGQVIGINELKQKLDNNDELLLLDVRTEEEYVGELGHIAMARNIALNELDTQLDSLSSYAEKPVMLICRTDMRSAQAALLLSKTGFTDVYVVRGGMEAWNEAGYAVMK